MSNAWTVEEPRRLDIDASVDRVDVNLVSGRVNLVGADDGPARVDITRAGRTPVIVEVVDRTLVIRHHKMPRFPGVLWWIGQLRRRFRVEVSISVPRATGAYVRLVDGAVVVAGLRTDTDVDVTSGRVTLMGLGGRTRAKLVSGPVEALGVDGDLTLKTVSGELVLADSAADRVEMSTVSGSVTCDLDNPHHRELRLHATSGSVTVRVREDADLAVDLHTQSGQITSAFPRLAVERHGSSQHRRGHLGGGTGKLWATTVSGSIALLARPVDDGGETPE
ncbi:Putative adhesin [Asanoa hainanensis]|uniref:Putative adhesin n=1 Tax=Asanoa hainanensis TaxID=560556 RepID=A0A239K947_9ACTN|nr:DUF4097 family beta strand repeat-containing protein [Asanoa hainanensis]SNT14268.1 Putative adhesin [Asanoa hainanensis]